MSKEFVVSSSLKLNNGNVHFASLPTSFSADQAVANGPSPGAMNATTGGVNVSFAQLTLPGLAVITNLDQTNFVTVGLYISSTFYPVAEVLPGESYVLRFSRTLLTANAGAAVVRLVADTASVHVAVQCFDA